VFYRWFCFICQIRLFTIYTLYLTVVAVFFCCLSDESFQSTNSELRELPAVELTTLPLILKVCALFYSPCLFLWILISNFMSITSLFNLSPFVFSLPIIILVKIITLAFAFSIPYISETTLRIPLIYDLFVLLNYILSHFVFLE